MNISLSGTTPPGGDRAERLAALTNFAETQDGPVSRAQLHGLDFDDNAIAHLVRCKLLRRIHREVYAVAHRQLTIRGRRLAAVLAGGEDALLSYVSNSVHLGLASSRKTRFDVTVPRRRKSTRAIQFHESRTLAPQDRWVYDGIPCTSVARTLLDYAEVVGDVHKTERAVNQAVIEGLYDQHAIDDVLKRANGRIGAPILKAAAEIQRTHGPTPTQSELEDMMLRICRSANTPLPRTNDDVVGRARDFHWPDYRLVVEVDGFETHATRWAFHDDRRRDVELQVAGYAVLRFTWQDVVWRPERVASALVAWFDAAAATRRTASCP